jgi:hypothetical protein
MSETRPFGTWPSPITAQVAASQGLRLSAPLVDGDDIYWLEARPAEGGRNVVVRSAVDGVLQEMTPAGFNVRTRVHEYGGGSYVVHRGTVFFSNFADQRLYRVDRPEPGGTLTPVPMTPEGRWHFADAAVDAARGRLICVREDHTVEGRECVNTLVAVAVDGSSGAGRVLAEGYDFYASPRLSPDGAQLAWICWRHPNMPWDGTELWLADVTADGSLANPRCVAGGDTESIYQPGWSPGGDLLYVSDRNGRWRLYAGHSPIHPAPPDDAKWAGRSGSSEPRRGRSRARRVSSSPTRARGAGSGLRGARQRRSSASSLLGSSRGRTWRRRAPSSCSSPAPRRRSMR